MAIFYVIKKNWNKALEITIQVEKFNKEKVWNTLIKALSAGKLNKNDIAKEAYISWKQLGGAIDSNLFKYIGKVHITYVNDIKNT